MIESDGHFLDRSINDNGQRLTELQEVSAKSEVSLAACTWANAERRSKKHAAMIVDSLDMLPRGGYASCRDDHEVSDSGCRGSRSGRRFNERWASEMALVYMRFEVGGAKCAVTEEAGDCTEAVRLFRCCQR